MEKNQWVLREDKDGVAIVTLNRPEKLNAISADMARVIFDALADVRDRPDLRVLLIRATGRYFTAGFDVSSVDGGGGASDDKASMIEVRRNYRQLLHSDLDEMEAVEKPVVMAIQGPCLGLGVELGGSCDFRLASESATFGLPEIDIGWLAGSGGTSRFTRLCGIGWAKWLGMAGERMDARTAMIAGFVQAVWPDDIFDEQVWAFCQRLVERPAEVQGVAKLAIELCYDLDRQQGRNVERIANTPLMMRDNSELIAKMIEKKKRR